ncbi:F0F1 ATP synthase subunit B [Magnetospirillum sp. UT-4]|uniref:F0F1 ATP synthase subunit B family protein n=1 Tax=Magnetospirillum sp. UT-4 TaxID=2681467 RepID=UPI00137F283B|nr:F0F1 ATP synthase subunit B [Magnetospirillum sp. UT-4]CAA7622916.1 ATP synthase subunit b [Magnetospirillum sp. UT-4]
MISVAYAADAANHAVPFYQDAAFWVAVAFFLVLYLLYKPVSRGLGAALDARALKIKARLDEAARLREDSQEMLATYQRKQRDAMREAEEIIAHAKAEAERLAAQAAKDLDASLKRREAMAMERIAQAEAQAMKEVQNLAVDVAIAAAREVLAQSITADQAGALVESAIKDLPAKLH